MGGSIQAKQQQQQQQLQQLPLRASDFPHNNILLGSGSVRVSQGDIQDKTLQTLPSMQQQQPKQKQQYQQQLLDSQKSQLNKFKQKFKVKQEQKRLPSRQIQTQQANKQKQMKASNLGVQQQFISIDKIPRPGLNQSRFLNSQIKNKQKELQKQFVVALKNSTALNNSKLKITEGKLLNLKRQIPGQNPIFEIQVRGKSGLFEAKNFKKISEQTEESSMHQDLQYFSNLSNRKNAIQKLPSAISQVPVDQVEGTSFDASFRGLLDENNNQMQDRAAVSAVGFEYSNTAPKNILDDDSFKQLSTIRGTQNQSPPLRIKNNIALDQMDDSMKTSLQNLLLFTPSPDNNRNKVQQNLIELKRVQEVVEEERSSDKFSSILKTKHNQSSIRNFSNNSTKIASSPPSKGVQIKAMKRKTKNFIQKKER